MKPSTDEFIAYRVGHRFEMKLTVAPSGRDWMNQTNRDFANRCLPMRIANQAGWVVLNDLPFRAKWIGGAGADAIVFEYSGDPPYGAISHFGEGVLTFTVPFLFRTYPGTVLLFRGPANMPKDAIAPLEGLVETDWAVASASMNWKFTRADTWIEFACGEPICMVVPQRLDLLEKMRPRILDVEQDPETHKNYAQWSESYRHFNERLRKHEPEAVKLGWQRYYFRGTAPHAASDSKPAAHEHRLRLNLHEFVDG
jgi:uncharacterized protein DUF6065